MMSVFCAYLALPHEFLPKESKVVKVNRSLHNKSLLNSHVLLDEMLQFYSGHYQVVVRHFKSRLAYSVSAIILA